MTMLLNIQQHVTDQLIGEFVSPVLFQRFKEIILRQYNGAQVKPGKPLLSIAEAFIQLIMQATLNTFHKAGKRNDTGYDALREVLYLPARRKQEIVVIQFNRRYSKSEIFNLRSKLVYQNINDILLDTEIEAFSDLKDYWWAELQRNAYGIEPTERHVRDDGTSDDGTVVLRLHFNTLVMAEYDISLRDVAMKLHEKWQHIQIVVSPFQVGIIDIYAQEKRTVNAIQELTKIQVGVDIPRGTLYRMYYDKCVLPLLEEVQISGIEGTHALYPQEDPILSAIVSTTRLTEAQKEILFPKAVDKNLWVIRKKQAQTVFTGISDSEIKEFLEHPFTGAKVIKTDRYSMVVEFPEGARSDFVGRQLARINSLHSLVDKLSKGSEDELDLFRKYFASPAASSGTADTTGTAEQNHEIIETLKDIFDPNDDIKDADEFVEILKKEQFLQEVEEYLELSIHRYAVVSSVNLKDILDLPYVDRNRTYSNNFYVMNSILGIEAARYYHVYNLQFIMNATGETVEYRYLDMFSSIVCQRGVPLGITFTGIAKRAGGFFSLATSQQASKVFTDSAIYGGDESTRATSVAISVAQKPHLGTGAYDYGIDFEEVNPDDIDPDAIIDTGDLDDILRDLEQGEIAQPERNLFDIGEGDELGTKAQRQLLATTAKKAETLKVTKVAKVITGLEEALEGLEAITVGKVVVKPMYEEAKSYVTTKSVMTIVAPQFKNAPGIPHQLQILMVQFGGTQMPVEEEFDDLDIPDIPDMVFQKVE